MKAIRGGCMKKTITYEISVCSTCKDEKKKRVAHCKFCGEDVCNDCLKFIEDEILCPKCGTNDKIVLVFERHKKEWKEYLEGNQKIMDKIINKHLNEVEELHKSLEE